MATPFGLMQTASKGGFGQTGFGQPGGSEPINPNNDIEVQMPQGVDSFSCLSFHPRQNYLAAASWDNQVRMWEVMPTGQSVSRSATNMDGPVLSCCWHSDGNSLFMAGCDNQAKRWDVQTNQAIQVAAHQGPIRHCAFINELNLLVTGSWDKTLKYWDLRQQHPAHTHNLPDKCYALSVTHPLLVVGTAERHITIINLQKPDQVYKQVTSPLKHQTRVVTCFPEKTGYLVGSIEGRVAVHHVEDSMQNKNFTFKCHREESNIYAVNHICFHPTAGTFVTTGSDGTVNFWDKEYKQRLKAMQKCYQPIPAACFNHDGTILAYAVSYDWSKGCEFYNPATSKNHIFLHPVQENDIKQRKKK